MKNILLATDLATETNRAFDRAVKLASALSAQLHIIHVCPSYSFRGKKNSAISLKKDAENSIKNALKMSQGIKESQATITVVEGGGTFSEIINHAKKVNAELVVMGIHNKVSMLDMFVGTTIERVIRRGTVPVLMVRDKAKREYGKVIVGADFSDGSIQAFQLALKVAPQGMFHLSHSYAQLDGRLARHMENALADFAHDKMEKFVEENKDLLKKRKIKLKNLTSSIVRGEPHACILDEAAKVKADLIAIGTQSNVSLMPYTLGGTAKEILSNPPCDVLIATGM